MKNLAELSKQRLMIVKALKAVDLEIAEQKTIILKEKVAAEKTLLRKINKEFIDVFHGNERLRKSLFTKIDDICYYNPMPRGLKKRLHELNLLYMWQIVIRPQTYFAQIKVLGNSRTQDLENYLKNMGLYLGMPLC